MKKLRVTIEGKSYDVVVEELGGDGQSAAAPIPTPAAVSPSGVEAPPTVSSGSSAAAAPGDVPSPLSGRLIEIDCKVGQAIAVGDRLVTIEAMKMNTYVHAQAAGQVDAIHVKVGDPVEEGQALVTIK